MAQIHNLKNYEDQRRLLRKYSTPAEEQLWSLIRNKQLNGRKFRRQHSVIYYVLDFYCPQEKLAIELDGIQHFSAEGLKHDEERTQYLNSVGIKVLRFRNDDVFKKPQYVLSEIIKHFSSDLP